jgi:hypothetical protein
MRCPNNDLQLPYQSGVNRQFPVAAVFKWLALPADGGGRCLRYVACEALTVTTMPFWAVCELDLALDIRGTGAGYLLGRTSVADVREISDAKW